MDRSPPGSSVHGILQARILEWVAISFSSTYYGVTLSKFHFSLTPVKICEHCGDYSMSSSMVLRALSGYWPLSADPPPSALVHLSVVLSVMPRALLLFPSSCFYEHLPLRNREATRDSAAWMSPNHPLQ